VELLIDSNMQGVRAKALTDCAEAILTRAACNAAFCAGKVLHVEYRRVGRSRVVSSLVASGFLVVVAALLSIRLAAAFMPSSAGPGLRSSGFHSVARGQPSASTSYLSHPGSGAGPTFPNRNAPSLGLGRRVGPTMCNPVPTPVDPAVASILVNVCVGRALKDLERLGVGPPRGGSSAVVYSEGTVVPDTRNTLLSVGRQHLRRLKRAVVQPTQAPAAVLGEKLKLSKGTATLLRVKAHEAVRSSCSA
jgi:hypothetical protein